MSLKELNLRNQYRSDRTDLVQDFYVPCLKQSVTYDRAVGFFSSTSLTVAAQGLQAFVRSQGRMRLIASPHLSCEDIAAIGQGLKQREQVISEAISRELEQDFEQVIQDRLSCLAWLLSQGFLEIRLAVHRNLDQGLYHEKLGVFIDTERNTVVFSGSANESVSGLKHNFECIDVFRSWRVGDNERIEEKLEDFQRLWNNQTPDLDILEFPEAARRSLLKRAPDRPPGEDSHNSIGQKQLPLPPIETVLLGVPTLPSGLEVRSYQQQAIENWFANQGRGTLKMATGSGKTITSLAIATRLYQQIQLQVLLVVCPYRHLVNQWARECQRFGLEPILAFESVRTWQSKLATQLYNVRSGRQAFLTLITTNATLINQSLQSQLPYLPERTLIIGDEAHNLGAKRLEASLPRQVGLRLALSATPERYFDDRGTQSLFDYFGSVLQPEFTLRDAIDQGALVRYSYHPILVELTEQEAESYAKLTRKIGQMMSFGEENEAVKGLMMQRSRLIGAAANKLEALRHLMRDRLDTQHTLFYCGDGTVEDETSEESRRQLGAVARILERIQDEVSDLQDQLRHSAREDIRELQQRLDELDTTIDRLTTERGMNQEKIAMLELQVTKLAKQLKDSRSNEKRQKLAVRRIEVTQDAIERLKQVKENRDEVFRKQLEQQIEELYGRISFKAYVPRLSDRYELTLVEAARGQDVLVGASTGENQILSLAFIGSVIERVRHWSKAGLVLGPDSSTFPVAMDSPFGNLDEIYRRQVARLIPLLANQLLVMASQTQWRGEVEQEMQPRIGKEYVLTFYSPKPDCEEASIERFGREYPLIRRSSSEFEYTEILEVNFDR
jgi:superfamily II DNA or RNA helicase